MRGASEGIARVQMRRIFLAVCAAALLPATALAVKPPAAARKAPAAAPWPDTASGLFATPTRRNEIGQVIAPVMIDGKGPFNFLVDTGADGSVVSPLLVRALGLDPVRTGFELVEGTTGTEQLPRVRVKSLRIGDIVKRGLWLPVSSSPVLEHLDGILGMAGFGAVRVVVDFHDNTVIIDRSTPGLFLLKHFGYINISARRTPGGLLMIPARVGHIVVTAVIDTGSEATLGNDALRRALLREQAKRAQKTDIYGVTKQIFKGGIAVSPTVYLGRIAIRNLSIVYADIPIFKDWHLDSRPALLIGMNVLGTVNTLVLDYPRAEVYILPVTSQRAGSVNIHQIPDASLFKDDGSG